ncbi:hypothetical protein [Aeromonas sp. MR16]|uniref:hypothetical protein n=1 Tax=Aeromonas sp. MR16 TaxID=2923420 RepID=UPI001F4B5C69|nr:hypothetical protein [Aeromonas sp. MR16]MCH7370038.1 hypothetical protein [Aeromonas sp. MR16]
MIKLEYAKNPYWADKAHTLINMVAKFEHLDEEVPFTASIDDVMLHGRNIFIQALNEEFGQVKPHVALTPNEIALRDHLKVRQSELARATTKAMHWEMMGNPSQAAAWRDYYQAIYALDTAPGWPQVEQWPVAP